MDCISLGNNGCPLRSHQAIGEDDFSGLGLTAGYLNKEAVIITKWPPVAAKSFHHYQNKALFLNFFIRKAFLPAIFGPANFEPFKIMLIMGNPEAIYLRVTNPSLYFYWIFRNLKIRINRQLCRAWRVLRYNIFGRGFPTHGYLLQ